MGMDRNLNRFLVPMALLLCVSGGASASDVGVGARAPGEVIVTEPAPPTEVSGSAISVDVRRGPRSGQLPAAAVIAQRLAAAADHIGIIEEQRELWDEFVIAAVRFLEPGPVPGAGSAPDSGDLLIEHLVDSYLQRADNAKILKEKVARLRDVLLPEQLDKFREFERQDHAARAQPRFEIEVVEEDEDEGEGEDDDDDIGEPDDPDDIRD